MPTLTNSKNPTQDDILRTLESIRNNQPTRQGYLQPQPYQQFMPNTQQGYQPQQNDQWNQNLQGINQIGKQATELSLVIAQNKAALAAQQEAARKKQFSRQQLDATANAQANAATAANNSTPPNTSGSNSYNAITGQWGGSSNPNAPAGFNPHAPLVTEKWHGFTLRMNSSVINNFKHFLTALSKEGYKIKTIGTYANRNIEHTNIQSLHALGLAMDINPSDNPVTYNGHVVTNLPPNVGSLAARYGLKWGGAWVHGKKDPMHFSVPYGGRE